MDLGGVAIYVSGTGGLRVKRAGEKSTSIFPGGAGSFEARRRVGSVLRVAVVQSFVNRTRRRRMILFRKKRRRLAILWRDTSHKLRAPGD